MTPSVQPQGPSYLDAIHDGKNQWWRYFIALFVIVFMWLVIGSVPLVVIAVIVNADGDPATGVDPVSDQIVGLNPLWPFIALMLSFVMLLIGLYIVVRFVHGRKFMGLVTSASAVNWRRVGEGFGIWLLLAAVLAVVEAVLHPNRYQLTFDPINFFPFAIAALILIPVQTTTEELVFRGYVLQSASLFSRNRIILSIVSGILFLGPHLTNPEVGEDVFLLPLFYFSLGAFLAYISLKDNNLELALGIHAANNLFTALFANYANSALATPAIFTARDFDSAYNVFGALIAMAVFYLWFYWPFHKPA
jgi:membrane protease YdiL (CAAX protease family)